MSKESEKRQKASEAEKSGSSSSILIYGGIVLLFVAVFVAGRYYKSHRYVPFAKCLTARQAKMYGLFWCPHCADQKAMFGSAFEHVSYVECATPGDPHKLTAECQAAGVKLFPSWQFGNDPPKEGVLSLQELSGKTGCALP